MLSAGARVVITGRDLIRGAQAQATLGDDALFVAADAANAADVQRSVDTTLAAFGEIDVS